MILLLPVAVALGADSSSSSTDDVAQVGDAAALIVLGVSDDVDRPSSASDLAVSLGGAFEDGTFPTSYAIEASPFWLSNASNKLTFYEQARGGLPTLWRNANLSLGIANDDDDGTRAALALRTTLWGRPGKDSKTATGQFVNRYEQVFAGGAPVALQSGDSACLQTLARLTDFAGELASRIDRKIEKDVSAKNTAFVERTQALIDACAKVNPGVTRKAAKACTDNGFLAAEASGQPDAAADTAALASLTIKIQEWEKAKAAAETALGKVTTTSLGEIKKDADKLEGELGRYLSDEGFTDAFEGCSKLLERRQGFVVDVAAGFGVVSPDETIANFEPQVFRTWVAPGWILEKWSLFFLARYTRDGLDDTPENSMDVGLGGGYLWPGLGLSAQASVRPPLLDADLAARATVSTDIRLAKNIWFSSTVGMSFPFDEAGSFVTLAGIKLGVAEDRSLEPATGQELSTLIP